MRFSALWARLQLKLDWFHSFPVGLWGWKLAILLIECEKIPSLKLAIELLPNTSELEERLVHLKNLMKPVDMRRQRTIPVINVLKLSMTSP